MTQPENPPPVTLPLAMSFSGQGDQVASFLLVISLYLLRSNNSTMRTLQLKTQQSNRKLSGASDNSLTTTTSIK